jgi:hypothetical protein
MTLQLELTPSIEANLKAQAASQGVALEEFALKVLEDRAASHPSTSKKPTKEGLSDMLKELAEGSENLPKLPTSSFTRESFYEDRT